MFIRDILGSGSPTTSFEFFPPRSDEAAAQLERTIAELGPLDPSFVSVTWGAGGSTREKTIDIVSRIKRDTGIEAMAHLTCVGATREEIGLILDRLVDAGIQNVLALRGDPPKGQTAFAPVDGGFRYGNELVEFIRDRYGNRLSVGGAAYPEKHPDCSDLATDLRNLKHKVDAGLDFLITQLFFDNRCYRQFVQRAREAGIGVPIIPGLMPITGEAKVEKFGASLPESLVAGLHARRGDPGATMELGVAHATSQAIELLSEGAPGIHFYTLNRSVATRNILGKLRDMGLAGTPAGVR